MYGMVSPVDYYVSMAGGKGVDDSKRRLASEETVELQKDQKGASARCDE